MNELLEFCLNIENSEKNYNLAKWYEHRGHIAAAHTYYLRASERTEDKLFAYQSLIRASFCYKLQGLRGGTEKALLENALNHLPERPEAYYYLSVLYEKKQDWQNCYTYATLGLRCCESEMESIDIPEFQGSHLLIFQKAVSSWWWGKGKESRELFQLLSDEYYDLMDNRHKNLIDDNMNKLGLVKNKKRIFDCFRFFNEKELLELRYHILKDHVDKFVILQGTKTQSGNPCELLAEKYIAELNLPQEKFIVVDVELPSNDDDIDTQDEDIIFRQLSGQSNDTYQNSLNARSRERILLDSLLSVVKDQRDSDVFLVSDCDEIIKPEYVNWFTDMALQHPDQLIKVPLIELQGRANLRAYSSETNQPISTNNVFFICTKKHFDKCTPFRMRFNINNPFEVTYITLDGARVEECGWHFSWMGDTNRLKLKQKSTSHYADQIESAIIADMSSKEIETYIDNWSPESETNVWGDTRTILKYYPKTNLPKQIIELNHLKNFFLTEDIVYITEDKISSNTVERTDIINTLIQKVNAKKYLEIGVAGGENLAAIDCEYKIGVDPNVNSPATFHLTSDQFFEQNIETFDVIFIDGLHHSDQVLKDILNSLDILNDGGYIVCHDMNPIKEEHQIIPLGEGVVTWNGDCWRAFVHLRSERNDLEMFVANTDHGCGIIKKGNQKCIDINKKNITYQDLDIFRKKWLNLIEVDQFLKILKIDDKKKVLSQS